MTAPTPRLPKWAEKLGWGPVDHEALWRFQGGKCAVCGRSFDGKRVFLDHDQQRGQVRGFLDFYCNRFYVAKNTVASAEKVLAYLRNPPSGKNP